MIYYLSRGWVVLFETGDDFRTLVARYKKCGSFKPRDEFGVYSGREKFEVRTELDDPSDWHATAKLFIATAGRDGDTTLITFTPVDNDLLTSLNAIVTAKVVQGT